MFGRGQSTPSRFSAGVNTSYLEHKDRCPTRLPAHVPRQSSPNLARHARMASDDRKATGCLTQTDTPLYVYPSRQRTVIPMPIRSARGVMGTASGVSMYLARIMTLTWLRLFLRKLIEDVMSRMLVRQTKISSCWYLP